MKGKISLYYDVPNLGKVRSRVENPDATFTPKLREVVQKVVVDTVQANLFSMRSRAIAEFQKLGFVIKDAKQEASISSVLNSFFDIVVSSKPISESTAEPTEAPAAEPTEAPAAEPTEAPAAEPTEAPAAESDEFED